MLSVNLSICRFTLRPDRPVELVKTLSAAVSLYASDLLRVATAVL